MPTDLVSIWAGRADGTVLREQAADEAHYAASLMKLPLAIAAQGIDLHRRVRVHATFSSAIPSQVFVLDEADDQDPLTWGELDSQQTLEELVRRMLVLSGNLAADLVLEQVGLAALSDVLPTLTRGIGDTPAIEAGHENTVTARDVGRLLLGMPRAVEDVLRGQTHRDGIPAGVPAGTVIANKTGWIDEVTHDAALVRPSDAPAFALVVLTTGDRSTEAAHVLIADRAREIWELR